MDSEIAQSEVWSQQITESKWKWLHFLADCCSEAEFRTRQKSQRKTNPKSEL